MRWGAIIATCLACVAAAGCSARTRSAEAAASGSGAGGASGDLAAPGSSGAAGASDTGPFEREVFPIVRERCAIAGCHVTATTTNHFTDFSTADGTYLRWVNGQGFDFCSEPDAGLFVARTLVVPFAPEQSFLIDKLTSTREEPCPQLHSPRMPPPPLPPLAAEQIETIVTWIREGAARE